MLYLVTNNDLVKEKYENGDNNIKVVMVESANCILVLNKARDLMHTGLRLETHPMAGSVKPNQNPYKTIIVSNSNNTEEEKLEQLLIIENAIVKSRELIEKRPIPDWDDKLLNDFKFVDLSLIESGLNSAI